jgi:low affinity Fe/Cu permease
MARWYRRLGENNLMKSQNIFVTISQKASYSAGHPIAFVAAASLIILWGISGPIFGFNDTWQLVINTTTTIITFLMVFLIQSSQNRDTAALQLKLDELIRVTEGAHKILLDLEELDEKQLELLRKEYEKLAEKARTDCQAGKDDTRIENVDISGLYKQK